MKRATSARLACTASVILLLAACQMAPPPLAPDQAALAAPVPSQFEQLRERAIRGDSAAALRLGGLFDTGHGVRQDFGRALAWYRQAAALGNPLGALNAGLMYDNGRGTNVDRAMAARFYEQAAEEGNGRAAYNLALLLRRGDGVPADPVTARRYMAIAAEHGVTAARGRPAHAAPASVASNAPSESSLDRAQTALLSEGVAGGGRAAADDMRAAAERGDPVAAYNLGYFYQMGIGVAPNPADAYAWYSRAARTGSGPAREAAERGAREVGAKLTPQERDAAQAAVQAQVASH
jgi:TPR repeat protein